MVQISLKGMGIALITPFDSNGYVDYPALSRLVEYQLLNGTDYLVVLGTTAETPTLTSDEQKEIIQFIITKVNRRIPIVLGLGGNNTKAIVEKLTNDDFSGIDAILSVVPYYSKPSQEGIYQHYKAIAQASSLPVILYNVPSRTGVNMSAETTLRLAHEFEAIVGIKEASGDTTQIGNIIKNKPVDFQVISGDDSITFPLITSGAVGVISVLGNAFPKEFGQMVHLALSGDYENALTIHRSFKELFELLIEDGNPAGIKNMLSLLGYIENELRLPLVPTQTTTHEKIRNALQKMKVD
jgi:4-hydroxy-tetrahydrodipicolinate synthase